MEMYPIINNIDKGVEAFQLPGYERDDDSGKFVQQYNSKASRITGKIQIICGVLAILLETIYLLVSPYKIPPAKAAVGIWAGVIFTCSGILGLLSSTKKRGMIVAYFVLSIFSAVLAVVGIGFAVRAIIVDPHFNPALFQPVPKLSMVVMIIEGLTGIVAACYGCFARICCEKSQVIHEKVVYVSPPGPFGPNKGFQVPVGQL